MFHNILRYFFLDPFVTSRQFRPWGGYGSMELDLLKGRPKLRRCRFLAKIAHFGLVNGWWIWFVKVLFYIWVTKIRKIWKGFCGQLLMGIFDDRAIWNYLYCIFSFLCRFYHHGCEPLTPLTYLEERPSCPTCYVLYVVHSCYPTAAGWFKLCLVCDRQSWSCPSIQWDKPQAKWATLLEETMLVVKH